jgi:hypothetical protein
LKWDFWKWFGYVFGLWKTTSVLEKTNQCFASTHWTVRQRVVVFRAIEIQYRIAINQWALLEALGEVIQVYPGLL